VWFFPYERTWIEAFSCHQQEGDTEVFLVIAYTAYLVLPSRNANNISKSIKKEKKGLKLGKVTRRLLLVHRSLALLLYSPRLLPDSCPWLTALSRFLSPSDSMTAALLPSS